MRASEHLMQGQSLDRGSAALLIFIGILGFVLFWAGMGTGVGLIGAIFVVLALIFLLILVASPSRQGSSSESNVLAGAICYDETFRERPHCGAYAGSNVRQLSCILP